MDDLRREKLRADRGGAPLSLVVFALASQEAFDQRADRVGPLLDVLHSGTRETDYLGHLDHARLAVLCPDTDAEGARHLADKIEREVASLGWQGHCATYPSEVFDDLATGRPVPDRTQPFVGVDRSRGYVGKRVLDIVGASILLVLTLPLMLLVAMVIKLTSRGPIIFTQQRLGQGGKAFKFYKFRSMVQGDDAIHRSFVAKYINHDAPAADSQVPYKIGRDPRITPVGKLIRKTSIDELPQLFNILIGDMSLVGPRPPIPYETQSYRSWHLRRITSVKPGLTGLWQVEGRGRVKFNEMVRMDLRYIRDCSLLLDIKILAKTFVVVLRCLGAA